MRGSGRGGARAALAALLALAMVLAGVPAQGMAEAVEEVAAARESDALVEETPAAVEDASGGSGMPEVSEDDALSVEGEVGEPEVADAEVLEAGEEAVTEEAGPEVVGEGAEEPGAESADEVAVLEAQSATVSDPRVVADSSMTAGQRVTWDCVWLGSYPQSIVTDAATIAALDAAAGWSASGDLAYGGATYRRLKKEDATYSSTSHYSYWDWAQASPAGYCYFLWEPVKWRVLEVDGSTALVVADVALDDQRYHGTYTDVTWEACGLRAWLNQTFRDDALTTAQQGAVVPQDVCRAWYTPKG